MILAFRQLLWEILASEILGFRQLFVVIPSYFGCLFDRFVSMVWLDQFLIPFVHFVVVCHCHVLVVLVDRHVLLLSTSQIYEQILGSAL